MDELDALLDHYEQQAAADVAAVQQRAQPAAKRQRVTAAEKRDEALAQPLGTDNKCGGCWWVGVGWLDVTGCCRRLWSPQAVAPCASGRQGVC